LNFNNRKTVFLLPQTIVTAIDIVSQLYTPLQRSFKLVGMSRSFTMFVKQVLGGL